MNSEPIRLCPEETASKANRLLCHAMLGAAKGGLVLPDLHPTTQPRRLLTAQEVEGQIERASGGQNALPLPAQFLEGWRQVCGKVNPPVLPTKDSAQASAQPSVQVQPAGIGQGPETKSPEAGTSQGGACPIPDTTGKHAQAGTEAPAPALTREERDILWHTEHRAAGGLYCGGGKTMDGLVARGLMQLAGRKRFVPDDYFRITSAGREALRQASFKPKTEGSAR